MNRLIFVCAIALAMIAFAVQPILAQDQLGIFFDEEGNSNSITTSTPYSQVSAWVQLVDPTAAEAITGFEFRLEIGTDGPDPILVWQLPVMAINILEEPSFMVGLGSPLAIAPRVTLAELNIVVPEAGQTVWLTLHPVDTPSMLEPEGYGYPVCHPVYSFGEDNDYLAMPSNSSCESAPVASLNPSGQAPQYQLSELPPVVAIGLENEEKVIGSLILTNHGPVSYSGVVSSTGSTPVQINLDDHYFTSDSISFQVPVGESIRITPNYSGAGFLDAVLQLEICGDVWEVLVLSDDDLKRCEWSPELLEFGEVFQGTPVSMEVELKNTGYVDLVIPYQLWQGQFRLVRRDHTIEFLDPGESCTYEVNFSAAQMGDSGTVFSIENLCFLTVTATVIPGPAECSVSVSTLDFGDFYLGQAADSESFSIRNVGGGILDGSLALIDTTGAFQLSSWCETSYSLVHSQPHNIGVEFNPSAVGNYSAEIDLGSSCGSIQITGTAIESEPECLLYGYPYADGVLPMRAIPVGGERFEFFRIRNVGGGILAGEVTLEDTTGLFEIRSSLDYSLAHNGYIYVSVTFTPQEVGVVSTILHTGSICGDVLVVGEGLESYEDCYSRMYAREFNRVAVGDTAYTSVLIYNIGYTELHGDFTVDGDSFEMANPGPFSLPVNGSLYESLLFIPQAVGEFDATVSTGLDSCPGHWDVTGLAVPAGSDRLGFYMDPEGTTNILDTSTPKVRETVYVVLKNPSVGESLDSWYLNHWTNGPALTMDDWSTSLPGQIEGSSYSKRFEADTPVLFSETMVLAEFSLLVHDYTEASKVSMGYACYYHEGPFSNHVRINDPGDLYINFDKSMLSNLPATPLAELTGSAVQMTWPCSHSNFEGFHVYRRLEGEVAEKMTTDPISCQEGVARYEDKGWVAAWGRAFYSVTAVHQGKEGLPSEEVVVELSPQEDESALPERTRLLAIYPNPFNPAAHISFELDQPGLVQIQIYDVGGRLVRSLTNRQFEAGQSEEIWNGRDDAGRSVPSNVYYARMRAGAVVQMQKMTLLK